MSEPRFPAFYTRGPQGNMIADHYADYRARHPGSVPDGPLGTPEIADRRDNRDPLAIGAAHLARNNGETWGNGKQLSFPT